MPTASIIVEFNSITPLISPDEWKETVYEITKYYPEIAFDYYPWKFSDNFGQSIIDTYRYIKYNTFIKKILKFLGIQKLNQKGKLKFQLSLIIELQ